MHPDRALILDALTLGVEGEPQRGLDLLKPVVASGLTETYALLDALAAVIVPPAQRPAPGGFVGIAVDGPDGPADVRVLPPPVRFAAQFVTACANRDTTAAVALVQAAARSDVGPSVLGAGIVAVYEMAVASAAGVLAGRAQHASGRLL